MLQMNLQIRARWTAVLRSGDCAQGVGKLNYIDDKDGIRKQCCLGVLCDLAVEDGIIEATQPDWEVLYGPNEETLVLPEEVVRWAGLSSEDPELREFRPGDRSPRVKTQMAMTCSVANDTEGLTFAEIADLIDGGENGSS
jgi:hypothetical protein